MRVILGAIYEPIFWNWSHGFPRECHTALRDIRTIGRLGRPLKAEGCPIYVTIHQHKLMEIGRKRIGYPHPIIRLIRKARSAGYLESQNPRTA